MAVKVGVALALSVLGTIVVLTTQSREVQAALSITQVHLAYSYANATHTSMYLVWHTHIPADLCLITFRSSSLSHSLLVLNYTHDLSEETHRNYVYKARLAPLLYDEEYQYSVRCDAGRETASKHASFLSSPGKRDDVTILIMGDWATAGKGKEGHPKHAQTPKPNVLSAVLRETEYSSIWHLGDLAYNLHNLNGKRGDEFFESIEPVASSHAFMAVPGNHEVRHKFLHFDSRLEFPSLTANNLYYSVNLGKAHIIMICTDFEQTVPDRPLADPDFQTAEFTKQKKWLIADLKSANKKRYKRPWVIVMGHKPLYCSPNPDSDMMKRVCDTEAKKMRESFENLFATYGVDLYIAGHLHLYERLDPVIGEMRQKRQVMRSDVYLTGPAPIYIVNGVAGNLEGESIIMKPPAVPLSFSAKVTESLGYGLLHILNSTHLWYEQVAYGRTQFDDISRDLWPTRRVDDSFWVIRT